jgi:heptosyltransferase II
LKCINYSAHLSRDYLYRSRFFRLMAQIWIPSFRKRVMLGALDLFARLTLGRDGALSQSAIQRILVIELWNIGDVVLAMPFLAQLRVLFPQAKVTMLARPHARTLLAGTNLVDEFIETELGWSENAVRHNPLAYNWRELARLRRELHRCQLDIAFSSRLHVREHVVLALSGARRRVAFALGHGNQVLTDPIPIGDSDRHKIDEWFDLLKPFGGPIARDAPRLEVDEAERRWAAGFLAANEVSTESRVVGIHAGASIPAKRWPLERFGEVAAAVARMPNAKVLTFVAPDGYGAPLAQVPGVIRAQVNLRQLIALIERCDVLVCNDSGPMHIAGALGVPTVSVFGSGIERWFFPLGEGHRLLTVEKNGAATKADDGHVTPFDIEGVSTAQVLRALDEVLAVGHGVPSGAQLS